MPSPVSSSAESEPIKFGQDFARVMVNNDAEAVGRFLADDWIIVDPDGSIIDRARFLGVIKSGELTHELMESEDVRVCVYNDTAVITALTRTRGKYKEQPFTTQERATDVLVRQSGHWKCVLTHLTSVSRK